MTSIACLSAFALALILLPILILLWAAESQPQRARRLASYGISQRAIADRLGCTRWQVRRALAAA